MYGYWYKYMWYVSTYMGWEIIFHGMFYIHRLEKLLNKTKKGYKLGVVARNPSAAPAGGYQKYHQKRQKEIVRRALEY